MPTKTFWILGTAATSPDWYGNLQEGGSAPTAANSTYGWLVAKTSTASWRARLGASTTATTTQAASYIDSATGPTVGTGATNTTAGDSFSSPSAYNGTFAAGNWTFAWNCRTGAASSNAGRIRMRVWASTSDTGASARELTSGALVGTTITFTSTTADFNSGITWNAPAITLNSEYLFFQVEWNLTVAGGSNSCSTLFRIGTASITTANFTGTHQGAILQAAVGAFAPVVVSQTQQLSSSLTGGGTLAVEGDQWMQTGYAVPRTSSLSHFDTDFSSSGITPIGWPQPTGGTAVSTGKSKFGGASLYLPTGGDLRGGATAPGFGYGDFTVDCWFYIETSQPATVTHIFVLAGGTTTFYLDTATNLLIYAGSGVSLTGTTTVTREAWHHGAVTRVAGTTYLFLDGHLEASGSDVTNYTSTLPWDPTIGENWTGQGNIWVDEFRYIIGYAVWTSNFTPPTAPHQVERFGDGTGALIADSSVVTPAATVDIAALIASTGSLKVNLSPIKGITAQDFLDTAPVMEQPVLTIGGIDAATKLFATGALVVSAQQRLAAAWQIAGVGALAVDAIFSVQAWSGAALIAGQAAVIAASQLRMPAIATVAGVGAIASSSNMLAQAVWSQLGAGTIVSASNLLMPAAWAQAGVGNVNQIATIQRMAGVVTFAGVGGTGINVNQWMQASAQLTGVGVLLVDIAKAGAHVGAALLAGQAALTAVPQLQALSGAALAGAGAFQQVDIDQWMQAAWSRNAAGGFVADCDIWFPAATILAANGAFAQVNTIQRMMGLAALAGSGTAVATVTGKFFMGAQAAGAGALAVDLLKGGQQPLATLLAGAGSLKAAISWQTMQAVLVAAGAGQTTFVPILRAQAGAALAGAGALANDVDALQQAAVKLAGVGTFIAAAFKPAATLDALLAGTGSLVNNTVTVLRPSILLAGVGTLIADLAKPGATTGTILAGVASFKMAASQQVAALWAVSGAAALKVAAFQRLAATTVLAGSGAVTASTTASLQGATRFTGAGAVYFEFYQQGVHTGTAILNGVGAITAAARQRLAAGWATAGAGALASSVRQLVFVAVKLNGVGALTANSIPGRISSARLAGTAALSASTLQWMQAQLTVTGAGAIAVSALRFIYGAELLTGIGSLTVKTAVRVAAAAKIANISSQLVASASYKLSAPSRLAGAGHVLTHSSQIMIGRSLLVGSGRCVGVAGITHGTAGDIKTTHMIGRASSKFEVTVPAAKQKVTLVAKKSKIDITVQAPSRKTTFVAKKAAGMNWTGKA